jgi:hypothetical protein
VHRIKIYHTIFPIVIIAQFYMHKVQNDFDDGWTDVIRQIRDEYRAQGIQVTIHKDHFAYLKRSTKPKHCKPAPVGLHFEIGFRSELDLVY